MELIFSLLGLNFPLYIVITILLAYFLWSKFLNGGELRPHNIDDISDIFNISIFLFVGLYSSIFLFMVIVGLLNLNLNFLGLFNSIPDVLAIILLMFVWVFIVGYRDKKPGKEDLKNVMINILYLLLILVIYILALIGLTLLTHLKYVVNGQILLFLLVILLSIIIFCYFTIKKTFQINLKKDVLNRYIIRPSLLFFVFTCVYLYLSIPQIKDTSCYNYNGYYLYDSPSNKLGEAYLQITVPIEIETFGRLGMISPLIPINLKQHNLDLQENNSKNNFKLFINSTNEDSLIELIGGYDEIKNFKAKTKEKFGFTEAILSGNQDVLTLKFDPLRIRETGVTRILLEGFVKQNMSELNYSYNDHSKCNQTGCILAFNITNSLTLPVRQEECRVTTLSENEIQNISACKFVNVTTNYPSDNNIQVMPNGCTDNSCELEIRDVGSRKDIFTMQVVKENEALNMHYIDIASPISLDVEFELAC